MGSFEVSMVIMHRDQIIIGVLGQTNIALTRWVEGSVFILIQVARVFVK